MRAWKLIAAVAVVSAFTSCNGLNRSVGAACRGDGDCRDMCLTDYPGGFCTMRCRSNSDCPRDAYCADTRGGVCLLSCKDNSECRHKLGDNGYKCGSIWDVNRDRQFVCVPD